MADPINYCSWLYRSFCISQSEWATWTQAGLTVATFAIALWRQETISAKAAKEKENAAYLLEEEKKRNAQLRARAAAISMRAELTRFCSTVEALEEGDMKDTPKDAYAEISPHLDIRLRADQALELMDATESILKAIHAAETLHSYLLSCKDRANFSGTDYQFLSWSARKMRPNAEEALDRVTELVYGHSGPSAATGNHAASRKSRGL